MNKYINWFIHIIGYAFVLITVSQVFNDIMLIDNSYYGIWALITIIIIFILNKVLKPVLVSITLPLIALTLGIFYQIINIIILKIADIILMDHFNINGTIILFFVSLIISVMNLIMDQTIIELGGKK